MNYVNELISLKRNKPQSDEDEYVYVFVRQDLSPEQQLVQSAHATLVLGHKLAKRKDVSELYFAVIGIPQLCDFVDVLKTLKTHGTKYVVFYEPDQGNTITAIATMPVKKTKRGILLNYKRLKFN